MKTVYKYQLALAETQEIEMPAKAEILSVGAQNDVICIWAMVDTEGAMTRRKFNIVGTGHKMDDGYQFFLGTVHLIEGALVFHIFEAL